MIYANTKCAKVEDNAVTATGTFAEPDRSRLSFQRRLSRGPG
jgi:hypothetical protein